MARWLGLLLLVAAVAVLALTAGWWWPHLGAFLGAKGALIQAAESFIQIGIWVVLAVVAVLGYRRLAGSGPQADADAARSSNDSAEALLGAYFVHLAKECSELPLGVIDTRYTAAGGGEDELSLPEIYVDLDVVTPASEEDADEDDAKRFGLRLARGEGEARTPVLEAVAAPEQRRAVLLGDAGSGKTTFVHYLTYLLARGGEQAPEGLRGLLPVRLVLREVAAHLPADAERGTAAMLWQALEADLARCLGEESAKRAFPRLQQRLLREGGLVLLDGLDEVPEARRRRRILLEAIRDLDHSLPERARLLLTARPYAYADPAWRLPGYTVLALAPFDDGQIERFVARWYAAVRRSRKTSEDRSQELTTALRERAYLGDLATRPLLLTLMATLHSSWGKLPEDRADLFEEITKLLLGRWQQERLVKGPDGKEVVEPAISEALAAGLETIRGCLETLAFQVHERQRSEPEGREEPAAISEGEVLTAFKPLLGKLAPEALTGYLRDRAGLLIARKEGVYAFPHRSFQEYLAGSWLAGRPEADLELARRVAEEPVWWREVFLLAVGKIRQGGLSRSVSAVRALVSQAGDDPELRWRLTALAGEALVELRLLERAADDIEAYEKLILADVRDGLTALVTGGHLPPSERLAAGVALARLGDWRPGVGVVVVGDRKVPDMEWIEIPAGPFRMGSEEGEKGAYDDEHPAHSLELPAFYLARYPVTNAQFGAFLAAGGYERRELWTEGGWAWRQGMVPDLSVLEEEHREFFEKHLAQRPKARRHEPFYWRESRWSSPTQPVVGVTWYEALAFCRWLDGEVRESSWWRERAAALEGWQVGLSSEAEWEKAARGGEGDRWPWGDDFGEGRANTEEVGLQRTTAVGMFPLGRSPYGLDDMAGNVWEWTRGRWGRNGALSPDYGYPYEAGDGREDLSGPDLRVVRGGSWLYSGGRARCASRGRNSPSAFDDDLGCRCGVFPG